MSGLRARGGFEIAATWRAGVLMTLEIRSVGGGAALLRYRGHSQPIALKPGETMRLDGKLEPLVAR